MEKLYLDIGNSRFKLATQNGGNWKILIEESIDRPQNLLQKLQKNKRSVHLVVTSVRKDLFELLKSKIYGLDMTLLTHRDIPNKHLEYNTPDTLGLDRFLVCIAASISANKDIIVIDAGSAITIDYMTSDLVFMGGVILPGKKILSNAIHDYLPELPKPKAQLPHNFPGKSTIECLSWGINGGIRSALLNFIDRYRHLNRNELQIYVTGGDSDYIASLIGSDVNLMIREFLIFEGMEHFLKIIDQYNDP